MTLTSIATLARKTLEAQNDYKRYNQAWIRNQNNGAEIGKYFRFATHTSYQLDKILNALHHDDIEGEELYAALVKFRKHQNKQLRENKVEFDGTGQKKIEKIIDAIALRDNLRMDL